MWQMGKAFLENIHFLYAEHLNGISCNSIATSFFTSNIHIHTWILLVAGEEGSVSAHP